MQGNIKYSSLLSAVRQNENGVQQRWQHTVPLQTPNSQLNPTTCQQSLIWLTVFYADILCLVPGFNLCSNKASVGAALLDKSHLLTTWPLLFGLYHVQKKMKVPFTALYCYGRPLCLKLAQHGRDRFLKNSVNCISTIKIKFGETSRKNKFFLYKPILKSRHEDSKNYPRVRGVMCKIVDCWVSTSYKLLL